MGGHEDALLEDEASPITALNATECALLDRARHFRREVVAPLVAGERMGGTSLTEPGAGSDFPAIATTARKVEGGWLLDGENVWLTNAAFGEIILLYAQTDSAPETKGFALFPIDTNAPGFERLKIH